MTYRDQLLSIAATSYISSGGFQILVELLRQKGILNEEDFSRIYHENKRREQEVLQIFQEAGVGLGTEDGNGGQVRKD
ncbi:hypothetical protein HNR42_000379 [Deinobacterium chartae]|uniref:Uncharacterized protein n=1 Tax=Deinobacterium chartae TaxID=521158 RepID=A0A841HUD9_9DEIO|nr:hypothetical protein [Deinobacterium chartae]MBB6096967.1 hypothetical protein [Deinobacterium chartae]